MITEMNSLQSQLTTPVQSNLPQRELGKDAFLHLFVTQMSNQDPLTPTANEEFVAQLAQFSSLEQMTRINDNLENSIDTDLLLNKAMSNSLVTTLIGKDVVAGIDRFTLPEEGGVDLGFNLKDPATSVTMNIYDQNGALVRTLHKAGANAGENEFQWDGKTNSGSEANPGQYRFEVEGSDGSGGKVAAEPFMRGKITGIRYQDGNAILVLGDTELDLGDVKSIMESRS